MGIALYLIWSNTANKEVKAAIKIFSIQLFLNVFWSFAFFLEADHLC
jgi:tryptophan-rich sensory protein